MFGFSAVKSTGYCLHIFLFCWKKASNELIKGGSIVIDIPALCFSPCFDFSCSCCAFRSANSALALFRCSMLYFTHNISFQRETAMNYEFQLSPYDGASLTFQSQLCIRKKRTESISREKYPKMWKITDHFNSKKVSEIVLKRRRLRYRVYGILLIIMGAFLLIPGLMEPQELAVPLFAGILGLLLGVFTLWSSKAQKLQSERFNQAAVKLLKGLEAPPLFVFSSRKAE